MFNFARICGAVTADALNKLAESKNLSVPHIDVSSLLLETPPDPKMGDVGIPLFGFAKTFKQAPAQIAADVLKIINRCKFRHPSGGFDGGWLLAKRYHYCL